MRARLASLRGKTGIPFGSSNWIMLLKKVDEPREY
jgi:hypothetical protein